MYKIGKDNAVFSESGDYLTNNSFNSTMKSPDGILKNNGF
jgi:hypothetical protein